MPNYCSNSILIKGNKKSMNKFYKTLLISGEYNDDTIFSFHQTVPLEDNDPIKTWGTKCDAIDPEIICADYTEFLVQCETAWSPPFAWVDKISKKFYDLTFTIAYCECGLQFYGLYVKNSVQKMEISREYKFLENDVIKDAHGERCREPSGRLKMFMDLHSIRNMGG